MKTVSRALVMLCMLCGFSSLCLAQEQSQTSEQNPPPRPMMRCQERFDAMDTNHDGTISMEEFMAVKHPGGRGEQVFKRRDTNQDGNLTKEEFCSQKGRGRAGRTGREAGAQ